MAVSSLASDEHLRAAVVTPATFIEAMANVCAPVTIITTVTADGTPYGTTVSAFSSLSLDPPMVTVSLGRESVLLTHVQRSGTIGVNILADGQEDIASRFARSRDDKFDGIEWSWDARLPRLGDCAGWLTCSVDEAIEGGDHVVLLARVNSAHTSSAPPLVYARRRFGTHSALGA